MYLIQITVITSEKVRQGTINSSVTRLQKRAAPVSTFTRSINRSARPLEERAP